MSLNKLEILLYLFIVLFLYAKEMKIYKKIVHGKG